jgi:hypothetical protein
MNELDTDADTANESAEAVEQIRGEAARMKDVRLP